MKIEKIISSEELKECLSGRWFLWVIFWCMLTASVGGGAILGFAVSGWAWVTGFMAAGVVLVRAGRGNVTLPVQYWVPWALMVLVYLGWWFDNAVQSAGQILCSLAVGAAASTFRPLRGDTEKLLGLLRVVAVVFLGVVLFLRLPMLLLGRLPETTGLAPEAISSMIFQSLFLCAYLLKRQKTDLLLYLACAALPVVALTRGPILGSLALVVLTLAPLGFGRRVLFAVAAVVMSWVVFNMPLVQKKMFWSGHGTIEDLRWENPNLRKHGRDRIWKRLWSGVEEQPWFGHGGNADAADMLAAGFQGFLPHNDWVRILFNYGIVGCALFVLAILLQLYHGWRWAGLAPPATRVLLYAGLSGFVPFAVVMFTDNILIYAQFYGNLHFLILGLGYGSLAAAEEEQLSLKETGADCPCP